MDPTQECVLQGARLSQPKATGNRFICRSSEGIVTVFQWKGGCGGEGAGENVREPLEEVLTLSTATSPGNQDCITPLTHPSPISFSIQMQIN